MMTYYQKRVVKMSLVKNLIYNFKGIKECSNMTIL